MIGACMIGHDRSALFSASRFAILKAGSLVTPAYYYAVTASGGTAQAVDPDSKMGSRGRLIVPDGQITDTPVQPFSQKYSGVLFTQITSTSTSSRTHKRGVSRSSRTLGAGCDGRGMSGAQ
jgi:hypothetical protein